MISFRDALIGIIEDRGLSLRAVADGAGVSYEQLKKLKQNKSRSTNVDDAAKIANFLGIPLSDLLSGVTPTADKELIEALNLLKPEYRDFLLKAARAQIAQDREA